jgi:site-specific DNA-adenine methylase
MLSYIGGKSKIGKWIVPFYDKEMEVYLETFGGMFWCFYNMDLKQYPNLKKVVYNDFNPLNYNLFKCVQNPSELLRAINSIDCQKQGVDITPEIYKEQFISFQAEIFNQGFSVEPGDYEVLPNTFIFLHKFLVVQNLRHLTLLTLKVNTNQSI